MQVRPQPCSEQLGQDCVIPAQAGIQPEKATREADKTAALEIFNQLDSCLRGDDVPMNHLGLLRLMQMLQCLRLGKSRVK